MHAQKEEETNGRLPDRSAWPTPTPSKVADFHAAANIFPKPQQKPLRRLIAERWAQNDRNAYLNSLWALNGWSVTHLLGGIRCPTLILTADQDYTPVSYKEAYAAKIPESRVVVIPDSRHLTPLDQPDTFNHALEDFISSSIAPGSIAR